MAPCRGVGIDFGVTWAKNALGTEKSIPTPFLAEIAVEIISITMIKITEFIIMVYCSVFSSLCY